jgi:hypothetical protein
MQARVRDERDIVKSLPCPILSRERERENNDHRAEPDLHPSR